MSGTGIQKILRMGNRKREDGKGDKSKRMSEGEK
jgi:hypothetical protein